MKGLVLIFNLLFCATVNYAQTKDTTDSDNNDILDEPIFQIAEQDPNFIGGTDSLKKFISNNIAYPKEEYEKGISGTVFLSFVIDKQGKIHNVKILRGINGGEKLNQEAIRLVYSMPPWNPARQRNIPVNMQYHLPIKFEIEK